MKIQTVEGDTVDLIAFRAYGRTAGATEAIYETNAFLRDHGPVLPGGLIIDLPVLDTVEQDTSVKLWD